MRNRGRRPAARARRQHDIAVPTAIAVGGASGALARHGLATLLPHGAGGFPWATFLTNVVGCLAIGVLMVLLTEVVMSPHRLLRPFLGIGLLGGFTTFSTYAVQVHQLTGTGQVVMALAYLLGTVTAALVAVAVGTASTRRLTHAGRSTPEERS
ncbi:CrcB family protein [Georgenia sp. 10Sc9-8]|uniref:Fluoride-specific ion channel FluC n=1 Tax=Georgenia halotolerans TaxID=3028317 RepID=A0ABT5TZD2_9MICO|nr:CrcB family protein [Georgenia halotolerans]